MKHFFSKYFSSSHCFGQRSALFKIKIT